MNNVQEKITGNKYKTTNIIQLKYIYIPQGPTLWAYPYLRKQCRMFSLEGKGQVVNSFFPILNNSSLTVKFVQHMHENQTINFDILHN